MYWVETQMNYESRKGQISSPRHEQCPQIGRQYGIKRKAAVALQCKLNGKQITALLFIPRRSFI